MAVFDPVADAEPAPLDLVAVTVEALLVIVVDKAVVVAVELPEIAADEIATPEVAAADELSLSVVRGLWKVPPMVWVGATALATLAAADWYLSMVWSGLGSLPTLTIMDIPFWQCSPTVQ